MNALNILEELIGEIIEDIESQGYVILFPQDLVLERLITVRDELLELTQPEKTIERG